MLKLDGKPREKMTVLWSLSQRTEMLLVPYRTQVKYDYEGHGLAE